MIPRTALALIALSALALAACGSDDDATDTTTAPAADGSLPPVSALSGDDLAGRTFESTAVTGHDLVEGSVIDMFFDADRISVRAGCNTMNGGYTVTDGTLEIEALASTMMACEDALMAQDIWLNEFLSSGPQAALVDATLTLTGTDATITLAEVMDTPLEGTTWTVTGTVANEAVSSIPAGAEASITISDGEAAINSGCNSGSTSVEITDTTITFGPIAMTMMACEPELADLETRVLAVLGGEVTYEISGDTLSLRTDGDDGEIGLELTAG